jgi:hypothetical protein
LKNSDAGFGHGQWFDSQSTLTEHTR